MQITCSSADTGIFYVHLFTMRSPSCPHKGASMTTIKMAPSVRSNIQIYVALLAETHTCKQDYLPFKINSWCANIVENCFLNILALLTWVCSRW